MFRTSMQDKPLRHVLFLTAVLASLVLRAQADVWAQSYTFTTIDVPGAYFTAPYGINNAGQVVGEAGFPIPGYPHPPYGTLRGFVYNTDGSFTILDVANGSLTGFFTVAHGINTAGQVVGSFQEATGGHYVHGFIYTGGSFTPFDVPSSFGNVGITYANGINNLGQIVGTFQSIPGYRGFLNTGGSFTTIDVPGSFTQPLGINDAGQIVGDFQTESSLETHGFIYDGVSFTTIDVPGSSVTVAHGINNAGDIVGRFHNAVEGGYGFLYTRGKFTTINIPGSIGSGAYGINDRGQIVGTFADASATGAHGFIATPVPTAPPVISITATPASLWPPNGKLIPVTVSGTITDEDSDVSEITAAYEVIDEYGLIQRNGAVTVQADGSYIFTVPLRALRNDTDTNGRQYTITVRAFDNADNEGSAATSVIVPHHQGQSIAAQ